MAGRRQGRGQHRRELRGGRGVLACSTATAQRHAGASTPTRSPPEIRDIGTEGHMEFGSRVGIWRVARMLDSYGMPTVVGRLRAGARAQPGVQEWIRERNHDVIGHGYRWTEDSRMTATRSARTSTSRSSLERTTGQRSRAGYVRSFPRSTRASSRRGGRLPVRLGRCNDELPYYVDAHGEPFSSCRTRRSTTT